jgi:hypothetical protein
MAVTEAPAITAMNTLHDLVGALATTQTSLGRSGFVSSLRPPHPQKI